MKLEGSIAVVTGAASGFGEGIAQRYADAGALVAVVDLNLQKAQAVAASLPGGKAIALHADVSKRSDIEAMIADVTSTFGIPNIVVNNAGFTHKNCSVLDVDESTFDRVYAVNVKSLYYMIQAVVPAMRDNGGGAIINIGSTAGIRPRSGLTWYNGSKAAVNLLSKSLAVELAPWKIRVNAICPVIGATGMLTDFMGVPDTPANRERFLATIPLGRFSTPADIAEAAAYLATSDFITGVELPVDGGRTV